MPGSRKWIWLSLALTLVVGMSLGVAVDRLVVPPNEVPVSDRAPRRGREQARKLVAWLDKELNLTPEQEAKLEELRIANREKAHTFWKDYQKSYSRLRREFRQEIRSLLDPQQEKRFDALLERIDARRKKKNDKTD